MVNVKDYDVRFVSDTVLTRALDLADKGQQPKIVEHYLRMAAGTVVSIKGYAKTSRGSRIEFSKPQQSTRTSDGSPTRAIYSWDCPHSSWVRSDVVFMPQTDNLVEPDRTCNTSAHAMYLDALRPNEIIRQPNLGLQEDDVYFRTVTKYGDTTDHQAQTRALKEFGIESYWSYNFSFKMLDEQLEDGVPVPIGILHRGSDIAPSGGHVIVVLRKQSANSYVCHDSYGSLHDGYQGKVSNGANVVYTRNQLRSRWLVSQLDTSATGWARATVRW